jgi:hypothetical protein
VLALTDSGEELELSGRKFLPLRTADLAELERHRAEGAAYLVLDAAARSRLAEEPALAAHLEEHAHPVVEDAVCRVYSLDGPARR